MTTSEMQVKIYLEGKGYRVYHRGWPDFLCVAPNTNRILAVEAKAGLDTVRPEQELMHRYLSRIGLPVQVIRAESLASRPSLSSKPLPPLREQLDDALAQLSSLTSVVHRLCSVSERMAMYDDSILQETRTAVERLNAAPTR